MLPNLPRFASRPMVEYDPVSGGVENEQHIGCIGEVEGIPIHVYCVVHLAVLAAFFKN